LKYFNDYRIKIFFLQNFEFSHPLLAPIQKLSPDLDPAAKNPWGTIILESKSFRIKELWNSVRAIPQIKKTIEFGVETLVEWEFLLLWSFPSIYSFL
jgi:hypothetical protein